MAKSPSLKIGPRDEDILAALEMSPFTAAQLLTLSETFVRAFADEHSVRRRLRQLAERGLVRAFPYAVASLGRSPSYYKLTPTGYRYLHGVTATMPHRRHFEAVADAHHHHTQALAAFLVHLLVSARRAGVAVRGFARENSLTLETGGTVLRPDCAFQLVGRDGRAYNFVVELDNGTERVRSQLDAESIERKIRGYDAHQATMEAFDPARYVVLFVTTRSAARLDGILDAARRLTRNPQRRLFLGIELSDFLATHNLFSEKRFLDGQMRQSSLIPTSQSPWSRVSIEPQVRTARPALAC